MFGPSFSVHGFSKWLDQGRRCFFLWFKGAFLHSVNASHCIAGEMPLLFLLTYTAHKSLHRRPQPRWGEFSRLANCSQELFRLSAFSERQFWQSFFWFVFHSFKLFLSILLVLFMRHSWLRDQNANYFPEVKNYFIKKDWAFMRKCILVTFKSW